MIDLSRDELAISIRIDFSQKIDLVVVFILPKFRRLVHEFTEIHLEHFVRTGLM